MKKRRCKVVITSVFIMCAIVGGSYKNMVGSASSSEELEHSAKYDEEFINTSSGDSICDIEVKSEKYRATTLLYSGRNVIIQNINTYEEKTINVIDELELATCIEDMYWINENQLAIQMHVNPSMSALVLYDASTEKVIYTKYGVGFSWTDDTPEGLIYVEPSPHFASYDGYETIKNATDEVLFETEKNEEIVSMDFEPDNSCVEYVVNNKNDKEIVYITDYDDTTSEFTSDNTKKIKMKEKLDTYMWNDEGQLIGNIYNEDYSQVAEEVVIWEGEE